MKPVTISEVKRLIAARADPAISIYMRRDVRDASAERARLRELLRRTSELLGARLPRHRIDALLAPLVERARSGFPDARSVAFLRSPGMTAAFALPTDTPDLAVVASAFHTKPLVRVLDGAERFVVLAIGEGRANAYEGGPDRLRPMNLELATAADAGEPKAWYHALDEILRDALWDRGDPVVLAGTRERRKAFADVSRYPFVLDAGIECDLAQVQVTDLHAPALEQVRDHRRQVEAEAVAQYQAATREAAVSEDLQAMCRAAAVGRVRLLLHRRGAHVWGRVDPLTGACRVTAARRPAAGDGDVIDDLCQMVLQAGGDVVEVAPERMPTRGPVAAIVSARAWLPAHPRPAKATEVLT